MGTNTASLAAISSSVHQRNSWTNSAFICSHDSCGAGFERVGADQVDPFALAVELAVEKRHDVQSMPDLRADDRIDQADFFFQFADATRRHGSRRVRARRPATPSELPSGTRSEPAARAVVGVDDERADGVADA